jgi:TonB family protein
MAVLGHAVFVVLLLFVSLLKLNVPDLQKKKPTSRPVVLRGLSSEQWANNRGAAQSNVVDERISRREPKPPTPKKEKPPDTKPQGQVVDVAPGNNQVDPNAKYLAESNNTAKKESRAKEQTAFYRNAAPKRTSPQPHEGNGTDAVDKAQVAGNNGIGQDDRPLREAGERKPVFEMPDQKARSEVAMREKSVGPGADVSNRSETESLQGNSNRLLIKPGTGGGEDGSRGRAGTPGAANLLPSPAVLDKISGAAANDHLQDVDEGEGTFLNTKEWKFASFFNRVKQSVGMHWNPGAQLRLRDPTGNIYGGRDRYTVLNVTLTDHGQVKEIFVEKSCGLDFLDLEAIQSFERAQPFPNPPPGLVQNDTSVKFSFGFFLEMSGTPRMRMFRSAN